MSRLLGMLTLAALLATSGCEQPARESAPGKITSDEVRRDAGEAIKTATQFSQQTKEEFQATLDARLKELDSEIAKLQERGRDLKDEAKVNWDQKMADLKTKREAARAKLDEVGRSSVEAWKDVQKGAQSAWDELDKAFRDASQEF